MGLPSQQHDLLKPLALRASWLSSHCQTSTTFIVPIPRLGDDFACASLYINSICLTYWSQQGPFDNCMTPHLSTSASVFTSDLQNSGEWGLSSCAKENFGSALLEIVRCCGIPDASRQTFRAIVQQTHGVRWLPIYPNECSVNRCLGRVWRRSITCHMVWHFAITLAFCKTAWRGDGRGHMANPLCRNDLRNGSAVARAVQCNLAGPMATRPRQPGRNFPLPKR